MLGYRYGLGTWPSALSLPEALREQCKGFNEKRQRLPMILAHTTKEIPPGKREASHAYFAYLSRRHDAKIAELPMPPTLSDTMPQNSHRFPYN